MILDAAKGEVSGCIETEVCVLGSGPAGLTVATQLCRAGIAVTVLESGGRGIESWAQALNDGHVVGDPYAGLRNTRHRQLGGTVNAWNTPIRGEIGAKYVPLEPTDLDARSSGGEFAKWPINYSELAAYYPRAHEECGLGAFDYGPEALVAQGRHPFGVTPGGLVSKIYRFGFGWQFTERLAAELERSDSSRLCLNLTAVEFERSATGRFAHVRARTRDGREVRVQAGMLVLACGAIENARLLLLARDSNTRLIEDSGAWIGKGFMEHPRDTSMVLTPSSPEVFERARFYDALDTSDDMTICGRLAFDDHATRLSGLPNMSITLRPRSLQGVSWLKRLKRGRRRGPRQGYGWSAESDLLKWYRDFRLLINLEQLPRFDNRVVLSNELDHLGQRRAELHWRWTDDEQASLDRLRTYVMNEIMTAGLGSVTIDRAQRPDPNAHHHAGTTRMASLAREGVVDERCLVFGTENLYVAGSSVFPTAGFANPTLTIVALAIRLAEYLREMVRRPGGRIR